jgi:acetolactate synthase I/II/III large subunit
MPDVQEIAAALFTEGVQSCFGVTGSGMSWRLVTALEECGVRYHAVAHEAAAAIMAGAFARQSGSLGCSVSIKGPGLANMIGGMLSNRYEQLPVLSVSEAYDPAQPSSRMHKRLDHRSLTAAVVKKYSAGMDARTITGLAQCARTEIPGPVHLDLVPADSEADITANCSPGLEPGQDRAWDDIQRRVNAAKRPMLIVGGLAQRSSWAVRLRTLQVPVFTTVAAKGVIDERHPAAAGIFTGDGKSMAPEVVIASEADLVIGLGLRNLEVLTPRPFSVPLVGLDIAGDSSLMGGFDPIAYLPAATPEQIDAVLQTITPRRWGSDLIAASMARVRRSLAKDPWLPGTVLAALRTMANDETTLVVDTGAFCTVAEHVWQAATPANFVASANGRYMGTSLPMAIGASLARPQTEILCVTGDGGIRPFWAEIKIAVAERLPICFLLMSDGRYGSIVAAAQAADLIPSAVNIPNASWFEAAAAIGCPAYCVNSLDALADTFNAWRACDGPCFIEIPFPPEAYAAMTADVR